MSSCPDPIINYVYCVAESDFFPSINAKTMKTEKIDIVIKLSELLLLLNTLLFTFLFKHLSDKSYNNVVKQSYKIKFHYICQEAVEIKRFFSRIESVQ